MAEGEKFRILIVDDVAETRENLRKLLQFEADVEVIAVARTGKEAIQISTESDPDVVLMDINMPDMDGIAATEIIRQKMPSVQVVILSVQGDPNYMRRAMLVGARDFLTKPPMPDELVAAIRRAGKMAREERSKASQNFGMGAGGAAQAGGGGQTTLGKIIMIYSPKGGTGCTTIAVNLAVALHNAETRVAVVDANMQFGDVAKILNEQGKNSVLDLAPRINEVDPEIVDSVMIKNAATGLHILASPSRPENAEKVNADELTRLLKYLCQMYAYVIVDTAVYLNDIALSVLDAADAVVLVTTQDITSIINDRLFLDLMTTMDIPVDKIALVMNRYDKRINNITAEKIGENLKQAVVSIIPLDERTVIPASTLGVPFMVDNKGQPAVRGIITLAEGLRTKLFKKDEEEERIIRR